LSRSPLLSLPVVNQRGCSSGSLRPDSFHRGSSSFSESGCICSCPTGAICDLVLSITNVGGRRVAEHLLAVEARWQARGSAFSARARSVLAVDGLLRRLAWQPLQQKRRGALLHAALEQRSQVGRGGGPSRSAPGPPRSDRGHLFVARRSVSRRGYPGSTSLGGNDTRGCKASILHGRPQRIGPERR